MIGLLQPVVDRICTRLGFQPFLLQRNTIQAHVGGYDVVGLELLALEVKFCEAESVPDWWRQCLRQAKPHQTPVLFYRASNAPWKIKMRVFLDSPKSKHQTEADVLVDIHDFLPWFENALEEWLNPNTVEA